MIITLDFETFFSDDFTLSKMTTEEYIRDPRFEVHGAAVKFGPVGATKWYDHADLVHLLPALCEQPDTEGILCHHAHFDGLIMSHVYGCKPRYWFDTLSMARMLIGNHLSASLENLAKHFGLEAKNVPYQLFKGKHWHEIPQHDRDRIAGGACHDVELTWDIFCRLAPAFPNEEYALVDATVRMFTEPCLVGNTALLAEIWQEEQRLKQELLAELGVTATDLGSNEKFAALLRAEGVEPEMKEGKNGPIYAFAKTDDFMRELLDHPDSRVQTLAEGRLGNKSNIMQTRSTRLGWMSTRGPLPVYLTFAGAHTTRWSGGDKLNWQNFPTKSHIAEAVEAPKGYRVVANDASQIECRLLNMVAGQWDKIQEFREGKDPYTGVASAFCGYEVTKEDHPDMRQGGKVVELQSGFGSGGPKIAQTLRKLGIPCTDEEGTQWRDAYRNTHPAVVQFWKTANEILARIASKETFDWGPVTIAQGRIWLPNGAPLIYETLEWHEIENADLERYWRLKTRRGWTKIYGAKLVENLIQALARVHVSQAWLRCRAAGIHMVSMEHDKLIACVREHEAEDALAFMKDEMCRAPAWLPDIPLDSEGYVSRTFAKEKTA